MGVVVPPFQGRSCVREVVLCTRKRAGRLVLDEARDDGNLDGRGAWALTWFRSIGPSTGQSSGITYFGGGRKFGFPTAFFFVDPAGAFVAARPPFFGEEIESARGDAMITMALRAWRTQRSLAHAKEQHGLELSKAPKGAAACVRSDEQRRPQPKHSHFDQG